MLGGLAGIATVSAFPAWPARETASFDAALSRDGSAVHGVNGFRTLTDALAAAPASSATPFRIFIPAGEWREHNTITRANIHLIGESRDSSVLVFNDNAQTKRAEGVPGSTLVVAAPDFRASHLTIANDFDYVANMPAEVAYDRTGASGSQARALHIDAQADRTIFEDVAFTGWQDTLFADAGRSYFSRCFISGCVDFIYGAGIAVFDRCEILSRTRSGKDFHGFIAAPDTDRRQRFGMSFLDCTLNKDHGMAPQTVALGRPWRHTRTFADGRYGDPDAVPQAAFVRCWMDDHIVTEAWYPMHYNRKDGTRAMLEPEAARLFEFDSRGPGAGKPSARRRQLTAAEARDYRLPVIFDGWSPVTSFR